MNINALIFYSYLLIGFIIMIYDWQVYQKPIYDEAKRMDMVEDGMAMIYMISVIVLWPIKIFNWLFRK